MTIQLNGEPYELPGPLTISQLLSRLDIDARRVAVELNLQVVKRAAFETSTITEGDEVEVVNFVGGGECSGTVIRGLSRGAPRPAG
jgi:thiamine biosynthesis protein ThiS